MGGRKSSIHRIEMNDKSLSSSLVSTDTATTMRSISPITPRHHIIEPTPPKPCLTPERKKKQRKGKKKVRFDTKTIQHDYEFEGDYFDDYFFVWPVLQKEMQVRKNAVRRVVIDWSIPKNRKKDPRGLKLAEESAQLSKWARDVATERGIKYCEMKRGGMLLKNTRNMWSDAGNRGNTRRNLGSLLRSITNKKVIEHKKRFGRIYGGQDDTYPLTPPRSLARGGTRHLTVED
jgi:hypothetical protein